MLKSGWASSVDVPVAGPAGVQALAGGVGRHCVAGGLDASGCPDATVDVSRHQLEVMISREHGEIVATTELREERVDRADLDPLLWCAHR